MFSGGWMPISSHSLRMASPASSLMEQPPSRLEPGRRSSIVGSVIESPGSGLEWGRVGIAVSASGLLMILR